jgi:phage tail protein X
MLTAFSFCLVAVLLNSCSEPNEKAHPAYQAGMKLFENHNYPESAKKYEEYLDFNRKSAETHLKLAKLYGDYLDNPFLEAYHYERYLYYNPDVSDKEDIEAWIRAAKKKFAKKMIQEYPADFNMGDKDEIKKLKTTNRRLIEYMKKLKQEIADLRRKSAVPVQTGNRRIAGKDKKVHSNKSDTQTADIFKEYTVKPGDNLSRISKRFYGSSKYYKAIYNANKDHMKSESDLRVGMKIKIPDVKR